MKTPGKDTVQSGCFFSIDGFQTIEFAFCSLKETKDSTNESVTTENHFCFCEAKNCEATENGTLFTRNKHARAFEH